MTMCDKCSDEKNREAIRTYARMVNSAQREVVIELKRPPTMDDAMELAKMHDILAVLMGIEVTEAEDPRFVTMTRGKVSLRFGITPEEFYHEMTEN